MAVSTRARLRRFWFLVHMWIGVGAFLLLVPISLTGSWLVWRPEIDKLQHPARYAVSGGPAALPVSAYLLDAQTAFGERARAASIRLPSRPGDPVTVQAVLRRPGERDPAAARGPRGHGRHAEGAQDPAAPPRAAGPPARPRTLTAWLDPATGQVLDVADPRGGLSMWAHDLHGQLFVFGTGRQVVGWLGVLMLVSCLSGVWLWWPKAGPLTLGFRWRRGPGVLINLHYLTGFWIAIPLAVLSLTGALISFPQFTRGAVALTAPVSPPQVSRGGPGRGPGAPIGHTVLSADQAAAAAIAAGGGGKLAALTLPVRGQDAPAWRAQVARRGQPPVTIAVADAPDAAARLQPDADLTSGDRLIRLNRQVHDGDDTPLVWKLIITLAGLAPALLGITGVIVWAQGQLRKAALRRPDVRKLKPKPSTT